MARKLVPSITKLYIPSQLLVLITMFTHMFVTSYLSTQVGLSWLAFFVPPEVISGRMVLLITLLLMLTHLGEQLSIQCSMSNWNWKTTIWVSNAHWTYQSFNVQCPMCPMSNQIHQKSDQCDSPYWVWPKRRNEAFSTFSLFGFASIINKPNLNDIKEMINYIKRNVVASEHNCCEAFCTWMKLGAGYKEERIGGGVSAIYSYCSIQRRPARPSQGFFLKDWKLLLLQLFWERENLV